MHNAKIILIDMNNILTLPSTRTGARVNAARRNPPTNLRHFYYFDVEIIKQIFHPKIISTCSPILLHFKPFDHIEDYLNSSSNIIVF